MLATNFEDFVQKIAKESPRAVVLDWFSRLELALREYFATRGERFKKGRAVERVITANPNLGESVAREFAELRQLRNQMAHSLHRMSPAEAQDFARRAFALIGIIGRLY